MSGGICPGECPDPPIVCGLQSKRMTSIVDVKSRLVWSAGRTEQQLDCGNNRQRKPCQGHRPV